MKLTKQHREDIQAVLVRRGMADAEEALRKSEASVADKIYKAMIPERFVAPLAATFDGIAPETAIIVVKHIKSGYTTQICVALPSPRRFPFALFEGDYGRAAYEVRKLPDYLAALLAEREQIGKDKASLKKQIAGVLASVTTWKKLYEIWPEAKEVLLKLEPATGGAGLPAVIPQELNAQLKLP